MEALLEKGYFDKDICQIKQIGGGLFDNGNVIRDTKFAIHRYGVMMAGFEITTEWYAPKNNTVKGGKYGSEGGHAVIICGWDNEGFIIMNSWGDTYADKGFVRVAYPAFEKQFIYGCTMTHVLDD